MKILLLLILITYAFNSYAEEKKVYLAGGCFWCLEEAFQNIEGVISAISGYSGGHTDNPTYEKISSGKTGHIEALEVIYEDSVINTDNILKIFFTNIDPFDGNGQFCDKGKSYRSVAFYLNKDQKNKIKNSLDQIEKRFNSQVVTLTWQFEKFYPAEDYHQDYYQKNFVRYLSYKKACQREEVLNKIWE